MIVIYAPADPAALSPPLPIATLDMPNPLPDAADLPTPRLTLRGAYIGVHLDDVADLLPELLALADQVLVPEHIVSQLANADPGLGVGLLVLGVQGSLRGETIESQGDEVRHGIVDRLAGEDERADVKTCADDRGYSSKLEAIFCQ